MSDDLKARLRANALDECDEAIDRIEALEAKLQEAVSLLGFAVDMTGEPHCWHDHYGYCQAHNLQPAEECWVKRAADLAASLKGKNQ